MWWISEGRLASKGDPRETLTRYRRFVTEKVRSWGETIAPRVTPGFRRGDGRAEVISIETLGANGAPTIVWKSGEYVSVRATVRFHKALSDPVIGMLIRTQIGFEVYGTTTELEHIKIGPRNAGETVTVVFQLDVLSKAIPKNLQVVNVMKMVSFTMILARLLVVAN